MPRSKSTKPAGSLLRSSLLVGSMTLLSRVLGLCRDVVIAIFIGANANADAFFIAFKVPNFLRRLFAEGAFSQAFVPVLSEYRTQRGHGEVRQLINSVAGSLGIVLLGVCLFAVLAAPAVTALFAPGFIGQPEKFTLTSELLRITFPYLLLISLTGFAGSILNSYNRFAVPAFTPVLLNLSLIAGVLLLAPQLERPVFALAWAVIIAGILQLALQLPFLARIGLMPRPRVDWQHPGVKRILVLMVPALFGVSVSQINLLFDTILASFLPTGSVSWLYYSDRLVELPLGVFGIAVATVILPTLSRQHGSSGAEQFARPLDWAMRMVWLVSVPAMAALLVLAEPLLLTLFNYGKITSHDMTMASFSLQAYALGLLAFMLIKVLAAGYYAQQDMKTPVRIGIIAMVVNMVLNIAFVVPLYFLFNIGHAGLALATSLAAWVNAGLLMRGLLTTDVIVWQPGFFKSCARVLVAAAVMVAFLLVYKGDTAQWQALDVYGRAFRTLCLCAAGAAIYFSTLALLGARLRHFRAQSN